MDNSYSLPSATSMHESVISRSGAHDDTPLSAACQVGLLHCAAYCQDIAADNRGEWPVPGASEPSINPIPHSQDRGQPKGTFTQHIVGGKALITPQCHRLKNCPTHGLETVLNDDFNN